ncbi:NADH-quinone oxidoreductase subunit A [Dietzia alimentaria]|uniref:NADH-quinone oxidoreductase subunit A n=1 Tax=Dietzia alimentaria TaxID=665550 RepID=UPI00029AD012|nr:NADH-quinone oxidoreductase subunit A [Dietzia alimentaria]
MGTYLGAFAMLASSFVLVLLLYVVARRAAVASEPLTSLPFLSGWRPSEHALSRYHARWYPLTVLFLAFDVEMLFMYPWAVVVADVGISAVVEMFVFLGVLMVGVVWAWREGALRWV